MNPSEFSMPEATTDYIIVGAGSAGCVLANRLSENGKYHVTLLEAGGSDKRFWIKLPIGYGKTFFDERVNWKYTSEANEALNGRNSYWPRGKVLGGSSSINAMVYVRGAQRDFDDWASRGNPGWDYHSVVPYFAKSVDSDFDHASDQATSSGPGPLKVSRTDKQVHPLCQTWLKAAQEHGFAVTDDFNGGAIEGAGIYAITTRKGVRESTAAAYLDPAKKRNNLQVITHARAEKIEFEGRRARGVTFTRRGVTKTLVAKREVILSAGAINSPQLLELSGIGNTDVLQRNGLQTLLHNANVGEHLQDHIGINYYYRSLVPTLNDALYPWSGKLREGLKYVFARRGHLSLSVNQAGGFVRTSDSLQHPNMQLYFNPISYTTSPSNKRPLMNPDPWSGLLLSFNPCRPSSRGNLHIKSPDVSVAPSIQPNYLSTNEDVADVLAGCHLIRELAATPSLAAVIEKEIHPGADKTTDEELLDDFRNRGDTVFHPCGTCIMGPDAASSVVDSNLKVHGIDGLRVVDASIFPNITSGNTNAPTIMVAEKGADLILDAAHSAACQ